MIRGTGAADLVRGDYGWYFVLSGHLHDCFWISARHFWYVCIQRNSSAGHIGNQIQLRSHADLIYAVAHPLHAQLDMKMEVPRAHDYWS